MTSTMDFREFELQIGPRSGDGFLLRVLNSPAGQAEGLLRLPRSAGDLRPTRELSRGLTLLESGTSQSPVDPRQVGGELFRALFSGSVGTLYHRSLSWIDHPGARGLRIRLRINPRDRSLAQLQDIPWELLYREDTDDFLVLSRLTPVVRSLDIPRPMPPEATAKPLRILLVSAPDPETGGLDLDGEVRELEAILHRNPDIEVSNFDQPESQSLRRALDRGSFHVLHYMGHGVFEPETGEGALLFRDPAGTREVVSGRHLATKLKDFPSLRLVVLNACDTARSSHAWGHDPFSGVATALVLAGVPAVVAMQTPIEDACAIAFSTAFYEQLVLGFGVDEALSEGRQALYSLAPEGIDWAIPVLFLRAPSGVLFVWEDAGPRARADSPRRATSLGRRAVVGVAALLVVGGAIAASHWVRSSARPAPEIGKVITDPAKVTAHTAPPLSATRQKDAWVETIGKDRVLLRFHVEGVEPSSSFLEVLRRSAQRIIDSHEFDGSLATTTVYLGLSRPTVSEHVQAGLSWRACQLSATCRVETSGRAVDLGHIPAVRSHLDGSVACSEASAVLAEAIVARLVRHLREASS